MDKASATDDGKPGRNWRTEAGHALNFWQALEYIAQQEPPAVKLDDCVWNIAADAPPDAMPWLDPDKIRVVNSKKWPYRRFQLFAGIVNGPYLNEAARAALGAPTLDMSERKPPVPAACVVLNVDQDGMVAGEVFVSALPWAMAALVANRGHSGTINFSGFFGIDQKEDRIRQAIKDLLLERSLIAAEALDLPPHNLRAVTPADMAAIAELAFERCGWVPAIQEPLRVQALRARDPANKNDTTQYEDPLNSFFAEDLERVADAHAAGDLGPGLAAYLAGTDAPGRIDLDRDAGELIKGVHPALQPRGCWPAAHPLVTAQQFAVNTAVRELTAHDGLFAVNGPPGTGKTTMLKDIVAAVVVQRADVMAQFDEPADAFHGNIDIEDSQWPAARLDARLQGFGIVVSSANNGAVENVSRDFPSLAAIAPDLDLDYFSVVADSAALPDKVKLRNPVSTHWGLLTAVLGNKTNRNLFAQRFWFEGFPKKPKPGEAPEPIHPLRLRSLQELVKSGEHGALPWPTARANYLAARSHADALIDRITTALDTAARHADAVATMQRYVIDLTALEAAEPGLRVEADGARLAHEAMDETLRTLADRQRLAESAEQAALAASAAAQKLANLDQQRQPGALALAEARQRRVDKEQADLRVDHETHQRHAPSLVSQLFRTQATQRWQARNAELEASLDLARTNASAAFARLQELQLLDSAMDDATLVLNSARAKLAQCQNAAAQGGVQPADTAADLRAQCARLRSACKETADVVATAERAVARHVQHASTLRRDIALLLSRITSAEQELAASGLTPAQLQRWDLSAMNRDELHSSAPYWTDELFAARRAVFIAAMDLHKSFIVEAWKPLRKSLSAFVNVLTGALPPDKVKGGVGQLWDAFFLVVPVVSTTFASFPRLFTGMRRESLAWLLIDEAGQAAPQQAVGAIWRARRTILVGDPRQLEPVVGVPEELISPLLERCGAEPQWAPPMTSAQTLADRANRYGMVIGDDGERIWLGAPLLVHRRCLNPMFAIANEIAYNNKMVYGSGSDKDPDGPHVSRWIDMPATQSEGHWIAAQAEHALALVARLTDGKLKRSDGQFKVYIVTPFRVVAQKIRELLAAQYSSDSKGMSGTVHTFQGKEAEHVIFLLGGDPQRPGVIGNFAGKKPNLVNVAVTRAKRRLYVIGDRDYWTGTADAQGIFRRMAERLPVERTAAKPDKAEPADL